MLHPKVWLQPTGVATTILQLSILVSIPYAISLSAAWYWWAFAMFMYIIVYSFAGNNVGLHRYFTHKHFETSKPVEWFLAWSGAMSGLGEPISYAMTHLVHHKYPDTEYDPHGMRRGWKSILTCFYKRVDPTETPIHSRRMVELSKSYWWLHRYYIPFVLLNAAIMYLIDPYFFLFGWLIPASLCATGVSIAVITQHLHR